MVAYEGHAFEIVYFPQGRCKVLMDGAELESVRDVSVEDASDDIGTLTVTFYPKSISIRRGTDGDA